MVREEIKALTPVIDEIAGVNLPYRGNVDHGVKSDEVENTDESHYWTGRPVEYAEEPKEDAEPIPVRIVNLGSREVKHFHVARYSIDNKAAQMVAGRSEQRTSLKITNLSTTETIFVGPNPNVSTYADGYPLGPGKDFSLVTTEPVYAIGTVTPSDIAVLSERTDEFK